MDEVSMENNLNKRFRYYTSYHPQFFWGSYTNPCISIFDNNNKEIGIGIRFFKDAEIRWLLSRIHEARPDLRLPKTWKRFYYRPWLTVDS